MWPEHLAPQCSNDMRARVYAGPVGPNRRNVRRPINSLDDLTGNEAVAHEIKTQFSAAAATALIYVPFTGKR